MDATEMQCMHLFSHSTDLCPNKKKSSQIWKPVHSNPCFSLEAVSDQRADANPSYKETSTCKGLSALLASPLAEGTGLVSHSVSHGSAVDFVKGAGVETVEHGFGSLTLDKGKS
eukprot:TRINITY_DN15947_c0_g3_i1.p1 TRINITY_DN15947_c0_g3~~TRINITY_DN15947_c0_g3_i1.p1  ORF type:complete len:114 (+),score=20.01 TRINITY_DN15947_c0_g3_i1:4-345(+)